jgi:predicted DNA-binding transcriptional regulator AlpA
VVKVILTQESAGTALYCCRGMNREQAALYVGVSPSLFDKLIAEGRMPKPKRIHSRTVWDLRQLDSAFDAIDRSDVENSWDAVFAVGA